MAGDNWNDASDQKWFWVLSANEWVLAAGEEHPTLSGRRALGLLLEKFGRDALLRQIDSISEGGES